MKTYTKAALIAATVLAASPAQAATLFDSIFTFTAAAGDLDRIDLNNSQVLKSFNAIPLVYHELSLSVDRPGFNSGGNRIVTDLSEELGIYNIDGTAFAAIDLIGGATFRLTLGRNTTAFGASFSGFANGRRTELVKLLDSNGSVIDSFDINNPNSEGNDLQFYGFTSATPFAALSITHTSNSINDVIGMDNLLIGAISAAVPEMSTWAMMMVGFAMVGATARYRRRATKVAYA